MSVAPFTYIKIQRPTKMYIFYTSPYGSWVYSGSVIGDIKKYRCEVSEWIVPGTLDLEGS